MARGDVSAFPLPLAGEGQGEGLGRAALDPLETFPSRFGRSCHSRRPSSPQGHRGHRGGTEEFLISCSLCLLCALCGSVVSAAPRTSAVRRSTVSWLGSGLKFEVQT